MISIDGRLLGSEETGGIDPLDRGFLYGDGLFETIRVRAGRPEFLDEHLSRLLGSAEALGMRPRLRREEIATAILSLVAAEAAPGLAIRASLSRGVGGRRLEASGCGETTLVIASSPHAQESVPSGGVRLSTCPFPRNERSPLARHKTLSGIELVLARRGAREAGADEALLLNTQGRVAEAAAANLFVLRDGRLATPAIEEGALPGILRAAVLRAAAALGIPAEERAVEREEVLRADGAFLTNSLIEMAGIAALDGREVAGAAGSSLLEALRGAVRRMAGE